jgi:hypothetical protein
MPGKSSNPAAAGAKPKRLPKSVRHHIRKTKAALRREHPPAEAEKAIQQLVQRVRQ